MPKKNYVVLRDKDGNTYSFDTDTPLIVATNPIYAAEENPDIYIKVMKHPSLLEYPKESEYIRVRIETELNTAKTLSDNMFPVPHVYYTKVDVDANFITGYIVMDKIKGQIISSVREFRRRFSKIYEVLNDLLDFGLIYSDMNINNFIVGEEDDEIYMIDFEDTVATSDGINNTDLIERIPTGGIKLNEKYIKTHLENSIRIRKKYRMERSDSSSSSSSSSDSSQTSKHSTKKTTKKRKLNKTAKKSPKSPKSPK
jgi:RIO-like serine/threonine protein kinase